MFMAPPSASPVDFLWRRTVAIVPALNEATSVGETVQQWLALGVGHVRVVDNGSADDTARVAREAGAEVMAEPRRGYGAAAWRGLQDWPASFDWVLFSSADGSDWLSPEEMGTWQKAVEAGADLVLGDRVSPATSRRQLKTLQRLGNRLCCELIAAGWGRRFRDMASLRLVRRDALIRLHLADRAFGWNVEMQVRALEQKLTVLELPVGYRPRRAGVSKISGSLIGTIRAGRGILETLGQLWLFHQRHHTTINSAPARPVPRA